MVFQCNSCGASDQRALPCPMCSTVICPNCKGNHDYGCNEAQRLKKIGAGPTVMQHFPKVVEVPAEAPITVSEMIETAGEDAVATQVLLETTAAELALPESTLVYEAAQAALAVTAGSGGVGASPTVAEVITSVPASVPAAPEESK